MFFCKKIDNIICGRKTFNFDKKYTYIGVRV